MERYLVPMTPAELGLVIQLLYRRFDEVWQAGLVIEADAVWLLITHLETHQEY